MVLMQQARRRKRAAIRSVIVTPPTIAAPSGVVFAPTFPADNTITGTWDAVPNADYYLIERTDTPGLGGHVAINSAGETTGTTFVDDDAALLDEALRGYIVYAFDADNTVMSVASAESVTSLPQSGGADAIAPGTIVGWPGRRSLGIEVPFSGDDTQQATATVRISTNAGVDWATARPLKRLQKTTVTRPLSATASTITLPNTVGNPVDLYTGWLVRVTAGTGAGQVRTATGFSGSPTRVLTVDTPWSTQPDTTSTISIQEPVKLFAGNIMWQNAGDTVRVEVTFAHPDGVNGVAVQTVDVVMKSEDIPAASAVTLDRYISPTGDDEAAGTLGAPWQTLDKAAEYINTTGGTVGLLGGRYTGVNIPVSGLGGIFGVNPRVDDERQRINTATRALIEYGVVTGPLAGDAPHSNVWVPRQYVGPNTGLTYDVYEWTNPNGTEPQFIGYADTYDAEPRLIGKGKLTGSGLTTDAHRVEFMFENDSFNHHWMPSLSDSATIILRVPTTAASSNPNDLYITIGAETAFIVTSTGTPVNGSTFRISGVEFRGYQTAITSEPGTQWHCYDHNLFCGMRFGITFRATPSPSILYGADHLVERNLFQEYNLRAEPGADPAGMIVWPWIKGKSTASFGSTTLTKSRVGEFNEGSAVRGQGGAQRLTIRYNTKNGLFNGVNTYEGGYDRYATAGQEVYGNRFLNIADDCFGENEPHNFLFRAFENRAEYVSVFVTCASGNLGPATVLRNIVWQWGYEEIAGRVVNPLDRGVDAIGFKVSADNFPPPTIEFVCNTFWSNQPGSKVWHNTNPGNPGDLPIAFWRNNILRCMAHITRTGDDLATWDEDYTLMASPIGTRVLQIEKTTIAAYRTATGGDGVHSNVLGGVDQNLSNTSWIDALFEDAINGNLTLDAVTGAAAIGTGIAVDNLTAFTVGAPDFGAGVITT